MSQRRCPNCGGLVGDTAEWCGQCFTRLNGGERPAAAAAEPEAPEIPEMEGPEAPPTAPPAAGGDGQPTAPPPRSAPPRPASGIDAPPGIRTTPDGIVWDCPTCGEANPIEAETCPVCGTTFGKLFKEPDAGPKVDPGRAAAMSLIFPGVGHYVVGRAAEGIARAIVFSFALATGLLSLFAAIGGGSPLFLVVMVVSLGSAAGLYVLSTLDAGRAAQDLPPIVSTRMLLYGAVGLMLLTLILLTIAALQNAPQPG